MTGLDPPVNWLRRALGVGLGLVVVWVASSAAAAWADERKIGTPEIPRHPPDGYLVLPFVNGSGVAGLEWMRVGLAATLAEKLEAHPGLRATYGELVVPEPGEVDAAGVAAAARQGGARWVFTAKFRRPDWKLELVVRLWSVEAGGATLVGEKKERGEIADAFELLDDAALDLLKQAGRPLPDALVEKIKRPPTRDFYAFTLFGRGLLALHGMGKPPDLVKAEKDLQRSVFIDPKFAEAHRMLALVYERKGQMASARGQLSYALDLRPDYYAPLALLVKAAYDARERDEAVELAVRALALHPWDLDVRYLLGSLLWDQSDTEGALRELTRITAFDPNHLPARRILVLVHAAKGDIAGLAAELEQIIRLDPEDEPAKLDLGAAYHALARDDDAVSVYEAILGQSPRHLQALKFLGDIYRARGDLASAIAYYERALSANREDPRPYFLLGSAYASAGNDDKAIRIYLQAQRFPRYLPECYSNLGALYYKSGKNDEALWYLRAAAVKRPANPRIHYNYGLALSKARARDKALVEFMRATQLDPSEAEFQYALGVALLRIGRLDEAEQAFLATVKIDADHENARHNLHLIDELRRRAREGEIKVE
jgi:tetratricopeptide (TPR) repeat protein